MTALDDALAAPSLRATLLVELGFQIQLVTEDGEDLLTEAGDTFLPEWAAGPESTVFFTEDGADLLTEDGEDLLTEGVSATTRLSLTHGDVLYRDEVWKGTGELVSVEGLEQGSGTGASPLTITLSGVHPAYLALANGAGGMVRGGPVRLWWLFFDEAWQPIDPALLLYVGTMVEPEFGMPNSESRAVAVTCESIWADRGVAPHGRFTGADQAVRFPGDLGLEHQPAVVAGAYATWPILTE